MFTEQFNNPESVSLPVAEFDVTALLSQRPARRPDYQAENAALAQLASTLSTQPQQMADELAKAALQLTGAHSAGLSLEEEVDGKAMFRWVATAGDFRSICTQRCQGISAPAAKSLIGMRPS